MTIITPELEAALIESATQIELSLGKPLLDYHSPGDALAKQIQSMVNRTVLTYRLLREAFDTDIGGMPKSDE